jgi:hypothetical protein
MDESQRKPDRAKVEEVVRVLCMIADEAVKLFLVLHGRG